jgi:hypothetical protein
MHGPINVKFGKYSLLEGKILYFNLMYAQEHKVNSLGYDNNILLFLLISVEKLHRSRCIKLASRTMECAEDKLVCDGQIKEQNRDRRETNSSE